MNFDLFKSKEEYFKVGINKLNDQKYRNLKYILLVDYTENRGVIKMQNSSKKRKG